MKEKLKIISLNIGRGLLVFFGSVSFIGLLYGQFEESFNLSEMSILEIIFWGMFLSFCGRHYIRCKAVNANIKTTIYLPLRNVGWVFLIEMSVFIGYTLLNDNWYINISTYENITQLFDMVIFLFCIFLASPTQNVVLQKQTDNAV